MLSANINLATLCLGCSAQALAQAGCNWNCPKRHGLTLAMQLFSSLLSLTGTFLLCKDVYQAYQHAVWADLAAACSGGDNLFLHHPTCPNATPHHFPCVSTSMATACPAGQTSRETCCSFVFFSVYQPGEATASSKPGKRKTVAFYWHLHQSSCTSKTHPVLGGVGRSVPSLSLRLRETEQEHQLIHLALSPHKQDLLQLPLGL